MRRLFRIYDVDRDGLLSDDELNAFQLQSFDVNLSQEDHNSLRTVSRDGRWWWRWWGWNGGVLSMAVFDVPSNRKFPQNTAVGQDRVYPVVDFFMVEVVGAFPRKVHSYDGCQDRGSK